MMGPASARIYQNISKSLPNSVLNCLLLINIANNMDPDRGLIWFKTVYHFDGIPERIFENVHFEKKKKKKSADNKV